ncbi:MAG: response regulator transcription factor [Phycisphaerales bacterium]
MSHSVTGNTSNSREAFPIEPEIWTQTVLKLGLTPQQVKIAELLLSGMRDKQIASALGLRIPTVRTHLTRAFQHVGVQDRVELILRIFAVAHGVRAARSA